MNIPWPIDDISVTCATFFQKKRWAIIFPDSYKWRERVLDSYNKRERDSTVISGGNVFPTVITTGNNGAWVDATTCFIETLSRRSRRKQNNANSTWPWWDVVNLAVLCVSIFAVYVPVWFDKHFNSYAVSTSGYVFHGSLMIPNKLTEIHDVCSHK